VRGGLAIGIFEEIEHDNKSYVADLHAAPTAKNRFWNRMRITYTPPEPLQRVHTIEHNLGHDVLTIFEV
jgi:hypothetical protein